MKLACPDVKMQQSTALDPSVSKLVFPYIKTCSCLPRHEDKALFRKVSEELPALQGRAHGNSGLHLMTHEPGLSWHGLAAEHPHPGTICPGQTRIRPGWVMKIHQVSHSKGTPTLCRPLITQPNRKKLFFLKLGLQEGLKWPNNQLTGP